MSAETVGKYMPASVTLDDLAAMSAADPHGRRYETSSEGVLTITPPPSLGHAFIATRILVWLTKRWPLDQVAQAPGIRLQGTSGEYGRIPDVAVWSCPQPEEAIWASPADLLLVVEIVSPGSEATDRVTKVSEYAAAKIPQYWTVARDSGNTVTLHHLSPDGTYATAAQMPLAWLLQGNPDDHFAPPA